MKKIISLIVCVLCISLICSACYIREIDSSRNYEYYPLESDTTYGKIISDSRDLGDKWSFTSNWTISMGGERTADDIIMPKDTYKAALDDLEQVMEDKTLYPLQQPEDVSNFTAYVEQLLDHPSTKDVLFANFSTLVTNQIADDEVFLANLRLQIPDKTRVYLIAYYKTNRDVNTKNYVFYSEDSDLIDSLCKWGEDYTVDSKHSS